MILKKNGDVVYCDFGSNKNKVKKEIKIDPSRVLDMEALDNFYETVSEVERITKKEISIKEWNYLIQYTRKVTSMIDNLLNQEYQVN